MRKVTLAALAVALLAVPALAQEKPITFSVSVAEANLVVQALSQGPYKDVAPLIAKLQAQYAAQTASPATELPK